jgi:hypothetical protein
MSVTATPTLLVSLRLRNNVYLNCIFLKRVLFRKPEGNTPLGRLSNRWEDNIKKYFKEIEWESVDLINFALNRNQGECLWT